MPDSPADLPFWRAKKLAEMDKAEWESLCDGCGKCCLIKLEEEDSGKLHYTDVSCYLFNPNTCRCSRYSKRKSLVPDCVELSPDNIGTLNFMPSTCAYRLLNEGQDLPSWHPLVSGRRDSVYKAGASARYRVISEHDIDEEDLPNRIVDWPR